ncbi:hypothetical protein JYU34_015926 [Plutella xylostella]|uniref:CCHC-type domain-containing protein n=1 Tax=Plutella xylostella TaxID=51655 RepID=A0ABQ7Q5D0_PLUXY|nr:hypothetical protein JYU34_015926 [Plutella xylostella]
MSASTPRSPQAAPAAAPSAPQPVTSPRRECAQILSTPEIQDYMNRIDCCLNAICAIATEGKLNTDQKIRIHNLCSRKVGSETSHIAVLYQALGQNTRQAYTALDAVQDKNNLSQKLEDLKCIISEAPKTHPGTSTFADILKKGPLPHIQPNHSSSIAIYPSDRNKSSEDTKSLVQTIISPNDMKLHVTGLRKTRNGGVIISTDTKEDIEKLKQSKQLETSGLTIDEPHKRKPRVAIIGVPVKMQDSDVFNYLYHQNLADKLQDTTQESFMNSIKLSHKSGKRDAKTCNFIIEVSALIRNALISQGRVFLNWSSCAVKDFTIVTRCYKCQQYGHAAKSCRETVATCGHCGERGHVQSECTKKAEPPKCATCLHFNKPCNHKTGDAECPAKVIAQKRYIASINYEDV